MKKIRNWKNCIAACILLVFLLTGCDLADSGQNTTQTTQSTTQVTTQTTGQTASHAVAVTETQSAESLQLRNERTEKEKPESVHTGGITLADIPAYDNQPYIQLEKNVPDFTDADKQRTDAFETYSDLDSLGRCGQAYANICPALQPTEERGEIGNVRPSGWHTVKYNDRIDGNYLYNRCHLIAYCLAGENANEKNLITGTRYLNIEGMLPFENMVNDYVDKTGNHVLYRVTPLFDGDNLVASGVEMEGWSVEDEGTGICFHVYCYNVQPGIEINYADGDSREIQPEAGAETSAQMTEETTPETAEQTTEDATQDTAEQIAAQTYILNTNTKKIHRPSCSSVNQMKEANKQTYEGTIEELESMGYTPCKRCNP